MVPAHRATVVRDSNGSRRQWRSSTKKDTRGLESMKVEAALSV